MYYVQNKYNVVLGCSQRQYTLPQVVQFNVPHPYNVMWRASAT